MRRYLLFFLLLNFHFLFSQKDTSTVRDLNSRSYPIGRAWPDSAYNLAFRAERVAREIGFDRGRVDALVNMGMACFYKNENKKGEKLLYEAVDLAKKTGDKLLLAGCYEDLSQVQRQMSDYASSINSAYEALKIFDALNFRKGKLDSYNNIANVYNDQQNYSKALEFYMKAMTFVDASEFNNQSNLYNNLGLVHIELRNFDTAMYYFNRSLDIRVKANNKLKIADVHTNMGVCLLYQGKYAEALNFFKLTIPVYEKVKNQLNMEIVYTNIGDCYTHLKQFDLAEEYLNKGMDIAKELDDKEGLKVSYNSFSELYASEGDFKKAFLFSRRFTLFKDSLINGQSQSQIAEIQTRYETEKQEKEIEWLNKEKALQDEIITRQNTQKIIFISGIILLVAFSIYIFISLRRKHSDNLIIRKQQSETEAQKKTIEEKNKEIVDSIHYARRIQKAMLASEKYVEKNINKLREK